MNSWLIIDANVLAVAIGGAMGALSRYGIGWLASLYFNQSLPWGTLTANVLGCLLIGVLLGSELGVKNETLRLGIGVGFLGSLTTFSTFSAETVREFLQERYFLAILNIGFNLTFCLLAVAAGISLARRFFG